MFCGSGSSSTTTGRARTRFIGLSAVPANGEYIRFCRCVRLPEGEGTGFQVDHQISRRKELHAYDRHVIAILRLCRGHEHKRSRIVGMHLPIRPNKLLTNYKHLVRHSECETLCQTNCDVAGESEILSACSIKCGTRAWLTCYRTDTWAQTNTTRAIDWCIVYPSRSRSCYKRGLPAGKQGMASLVASRRRVRKGRACPL